VPRLLALTSVGPAGGVVVIGVAFCVAPHPIAPTAPANATTWINRYMCLPSCMSFRLSLSCVETDAPAEQTSVTLLKRKAMHGPFTLLCGVAEMRSAVR
jgi:hypothetical protein